MHDIRKKPNDRKWSDRLQRSGYFFMVLLLNLVLFLMLAGIVVWKPFQKPEEINFQKISIQPLSPPPSPPAASGSQSRSVSDPTPINVAPITPISILMSHHSNVEIKIDSTDLLKQQLLNHLSDFPSQGTGLDPGRGGDGGNGPGGFFGQASGNPTAGLVGTFYDFTRTQDGKPTNITAENYAVIIRKFVAGWQPASDTLCYTSPTLLYTKYLFFPPIADHLAGAAFQTPSSSEAFWIAHYHGSFVPNQTGKFYLIGFGDNLMAVRINDRLVLDASDLGYLHYSRQAEGGITLPGKGSATPLFLSDSINLQDGFSMHIDAIVGD